MKTLHKILVALRLDGIRAQYTTLGAWTLYPLHLLSVVVFIILAYPIIYLYIAFTRYVEPLFFKPTPPK